MDRRVYVPKDKVALLKFFGLEFEVSIIILEDKLEVRFWTSLPKIDRYFYENVAYIVSVIVG